MVTNTRRSFLKVSGALLGGIAAGFGTATATESQDRFIVVPSGDLSGDFEIVHDLTPIGLVVVRSSAEALSQSAMVDDFAPDIDLELSEPLAQSLTLDDASIDYSGFYDDYLWDKQNLGIAELHSMGYTGEGVSISVIDEGVWDAHPDLTNVDVGRSLNFTQDGFDHNPRYDCRGTPSDHGTHVAGTAAATNASGSGMVGTAPDASIVDCRVFAQGSCGASFSNIIAAVVYSASPADTTLVVNGEEVPGAACDVANLSLGAYPIPRQDLTQFYGTVLNSAMTYANRVGCLLTISAGNDAADLQHDRNFISLPNEGAQACCVSATGPIGFGRDPTVFGYEPAPVESPAFYTNYGTNAVTIGAPGGDAFLPARGVDPLWYLDLVFSTVFTFPSGTGYWDYTDNNPPRAVNYGWKAGTSMAAPQVAGAAALVKSANPSYNANAVEAALMRAASVPKGYGKPYYGSGYLNIADAL